MQDLSSDIRTQRWGEVQETILAPYMIMPVFLQAIGIKEKRFKVTNKAAVQAKERYPVWASASSAVGADRDRNREVQLRQIRFGNLLRQRHHFLVVDAFVQSHFFGPVLFGQACL